MALRVNVRNGAGGDIFHDNDTIQGEVIIDALDPMVKLNVISVQVLCRIEVSFVSDDYPISGEHLIHTSVTGSYPFFFQNVVMKHDTYGQGCINLRYLLKVVMKPGVDGMMIVNEHEFMVLNCKPPPAVNIPLKLMFDFPGNFSVVVELEKSSFHLEELIQGELQFVCLNESRSDTKICIELVKSVSAVNSNAIYELGRMTTLAKHEFEVDSIDTGVAFEFDLRKYGVTPTFSNAVFKVDYHIKLFLKVADACDEVADACDEDDDACDEDDDACDEDDDAFYGEDDDDVHGEDADAVYDEDSDAVYDENGVRVYVEDDTVYGVYAEDADAVYAEDADAVYAEDVDIGYAEDCETSDCEFHQTGDDEDDYTSYHGVPLVQKEVFLYRLQH